MIKKPRKAKEYASSYRPITLTSQFGKWFERIIATRLDTFLETNNKYHPKQAGYRKGRSTVDQLVRLTSAVERGFSEGKPRLTGALLIDIEKAFDGMA